MSKEKNNKDSKDKKYSNLSQENEIIEEIISNSLILKDIEDLEEEEYEDSYSEKDKITEEILNNNLSFIHHDENQQKAKDLKAYIDKNSAKIQKDFILNLLIEIFEYYYNDKTEEKKIYIENRIKETKNRIEFYCTKFTKNFSKYILLILDQKIDDLMCHVENLINIKVKTVKDILEIKSSLNLTGHDVCKIFEKPFQKTQSFDISNILIVLFITDIINDKKISLNNEDIDQIIQSESYEEKEKFEKYIEELKSFVVNGENDDEEIEIYYEEEEKQCENETESNSPLNQNNNKEKLINEENKNRDKEIDKNIENKDMIFNEKIDNKKSIIKSDENISKNNDDKNQNCSTKKLKNKNIIDNKIEKYSNIEDLVNYINGDNNEKKRKKKKKKKAKTPKTNITEEEKENIVEKDDIYENFKSNLKNFTDKLQKVKKITPKISEAFIEKLKLMN